MQVNKKPFTSVNLVSYASLSSNKQTLSSNKQTKKAKYNNKLLFLSKAKYKNKLLFLSKTYFQIIF